MVFIGVDYNWWFWNYIKITRFTMFVRGGEGVYTNLVPFAGGGAYQNWTLGTRGKGV